jgi:hypothetical protein
MPRPRKLDALSLAELNQLIAQRRRHIRELRRQRKALAKQLAAVDRELGGLEGSAGRGVRGRARHQLSLVDLIEQILKESGKPMRVNEITQAAEDKGYRSTSPNFRSIVNQMLIKHKKRFEAAERGLYQIRK